MPSLDTIPLTISPDQTANYEFPVGSGLNQSVSYFEPYGPGSDQLVSYNLTGIPCWEPYTQALLGYLAPEVFRAQADSNSLLHQVMAMVAREISGCTESVTFTGSDARGLGTFAVRVRFGPIVSVTSVQRVDGSGNILETYTVTGTDGDKQINLSGVTPPKAGDNLLVTYTYLHKGLEFATLEALQQLNILTSTGDFLDAWGQWFGIPRQITGTYGSDTYGDGRYGTPGTEDDAHYSRRIIDRVLQTRNTKASIIAAVQTATGGNVYIVEWFDPSNPTGFILAVNPASFWAGGESPSAISEHLIFGRTARFRNGAVPGGGSFVFDVYVPKGSGYSVPRLLEIVNAYRSAGTRAFIRFQGT